MVVSQVLYNLVLPCSNACLTRHAFYEVSEMSPGTALLVYIATRAEAPGSKDVDLPSRGDVFAQHRMHVAPRYVIRRSTRADLASLPHVWRRHASGHHGSIPRCHLHLSSITRSSTLIPSVAGQASATTRR